MHPKPSTLPKPPKPRVSKPKKSTLAKPPKPRQPKPLKSTLNSEIYKLKLISIHKDDYYSW